MAMPSYPPLNHPVVDPRTGLVTVPWRNYFTGVQANVPSGGAAPADAGYVVDASDPGIPNARVATDSISIDVNTGTPGVMTWLRAALTGDVTAAANSNATTIPNDTVTYAKMQNVSAASRLLGRGSAGGAGDVEEITLGSGLTMTGTSLSASGSGGTVTTTGSPANGNLTKFSGATTITNADLTGDVTTAGGVATTLANTAVTPGTYGDASHVGQFTVDSKGRLTAAVDVAIAGVSWIPMVDGSEPPNFITDGSGVLILVAGP